MATALLDKPELDSDNERPTPASAHTPSAAEIALVGHVKSLFYRARDRKREMLNQWVTNYRVLHNQGTWPAGRPNWMPRPEVSEIYPIVRKIVAWETDQRPQFEIGPAAQPFEAFYEFYNDLANTLKTVMNSVWQNEDYDAEIEKSRWDVHVYGTGILKAFWDPSLAGGLGNPMLARVDPFTFYPDAAARGMKDSNSFHEVRTMSIQEMEKRFPGSKKKIGNWGYVEEAPEAPTRNGQSEPPRSNPGAVSPATSASWDNGRDTEVDPVDDPGVTVFESWLKCPMTTTIDGKECTYDTWRVVVVAKDRVLMDKSALELWAHGQHPYIRTVAEETGEFWGMSMVELLTPPQLSINRLLAAIEHNIWLTGNPILKEDSGAGTGRTRVSNVPGQRFQYRRGGTVEWMNPPQTNPSTTAELIRFYINEMERISGLSAIVRGATPTGRNAQGVIDSIQESAFVDIRKNLRNLERGLRTAGQLCASMIVEFYDTPRMMAIVGPGGEKTSLALRGKHFYLPSKEGRVPMRFQLLVSAGSGLPLSPEARAAKADMLYAMGALPVRRLLEAHNWPNYNQIADEVEQMQAAAGTVGQPPGSRQRAGRTT